MSVSPMAVQIFDTMERKKAAERIRLPARTSHETSVDVLHGSKAHSSFKDSEVFFFLPKEFP